MAKICTYCGSEIGFARRLLGESFCSSEHKGLYLERQSQKGIQRLRSVIADDSESALRRSEAQATQEQAIDELENEPLVSPLATDAAARR